MSFLVQVLKIKQSGLVSIQTHNVPSPTVLKVAKWPQKIADSLKMKAFKIPRGVT